MDNVYVWYSGATNLTGEALMKELKCKGGVTAPKAKEIDTVVCWGTKTDKDTAFAAGIKVYNHPNKIRANRNKFSALDVLRKAGCSVAASTTNLKANNNIGFPAVARSNFHQGGKGFWLCMNQHHLDIAAKEGAQYVQAFIHIQDEYRLHMFEGKLIYAVKKVPRDNMQDAYVAQYVEKIEAWAAKNNEQLDKNTMTKVLQRVARTEAEKPDYIIRSNTRGWKFSHIAAPPQKLVDEAVKAIAALGLNYGAVDCCMNLEGNPRIIEVNSGPGLDGTTFDTWVKSFKELLTPKKAPAVPKAKQAAVDNAEVVAFAAKKAVGAKAALKKKLELFNELIDAADDEEAETLGKIWAKVANKKNA